MAYRFNGTSDYVQFAITPLSGYVIGPITVAMLLKRNSIGTNVIATSISDGATTVQAIPLEFRTTNIARAQIGGTIRTSSQTFASTSLWYLLVYTWAGGTATSRFHVHDETSWTHVDSTGTYANQAALASTCRLLIGAHPAPANYLPADVCCVGIKKADSSDAAVQTLSRTSFQAWRDFGFDWLIGFDSSLETAGILQDQSSAGTGDEVAITGTTQVTDPPGWAWSSATTPVADFTATPLTGARPLNVAFTDTSTNTPTSWAWTFGDGGTSTSQNPSHSYAAAGTYTVALTATNAGGSDTKTRTGYVTVANPSGTLTKIKWGTGLVVTDEGAGVIRADAVGVVGPVGPAGPPGPTGPSGQAAGRIFYLAPSDASDISSYKTLLSSPSAGAETTIATACSGTSDTLIATFATDPGVPGAVDYPAGTAYRRIYAMVSGGSARLHLLVYKRDAAGTETLIRDELSDIFTDTTVALQSWTATASAAGAMLATDRIVTKLYAQRVSGPATTTVTTYYEGTAHVSQIQTTISAGAQGPPGPGVPTGGTTGQILTKTSSTDYATAWQAPAAIPLVTSLPGSPVDGQEIYYLADATNGLIWHLRYRSASSSAYKWEYIGGAPLVNEYGTAESWPNVNQNTWAAVSVNDPKLTVPLTGDYDADAIAALGLAVAGPVAIGLKVGATEPIAGTNATSSYVPAAGMYTVLTQRRRLTGVSAATVIVQRYIHAAAAPATLSRMTAHLSLWPIRVG